jgi:hypothetical protein
MQSFKKHLNLLYCIDVNIGKKRFLNFSVKIILSQPTAIVNECMIIKCPNFTDLVPEPANERQTPEIASHVAVQFRGGCCGSLP